MGNNLDSICPSTVFCTFEPLSCCLFTYFFCYDSFVHWTKSKVRSFNFPSCCPPLSTDLTATKSQIAFVSRSHLHSHLFNTVSTMTASWIIVSGGAENISTKYSNPNQQDQWYCWSVFWSASGYAQPCAQPSHLDDQLNDHPERKIPSLRSNL